jgi:hypothetical protein
MAQFVSENENNQAVWELEARAFSDAQTSPPAFAEPVGSPPRAYRLRVGARISAVIAALGEDARDLVLAKSAEDATMHPPARAKAPVTMIWSENVARVLGLPPNSVASRLADTRTRTQEARRIVSEASAGLAKLRRSQ